MSVDKKLEEDQALVHESAGQAARAPELLTLRHRNTVNGGIRNMVFDRGGMLMLVFGYHKGFSRTERLKAIHRFLPREVTTVILYFLWLVLPFWEDVQANVWGVTGFPATLWGMPKDTDELVEVAVGESGDVTGTRKTRLGAGPHWTPARMARILERTSFAGCGKKINISSWRHISIALGRRYFRDANTAHSSLLDEFDSENSDSDEEDDSPCDLQAGHGSQVAGLIYGRLVTEGAFETNERRVNFRQISEEWHRLLGFPSAIHGLDRSLRPGHKRKSPSLHFEAMKRLQAHRWRTLSSVNLERALWRLYGDKARFRGVQRQAVEAVMANKSPLVVVMGTGGGKSLCFMLPAASCPGGITIVIVPLVSLQGDMVDRCRASDISCAEWRSDRPPGLVAIVFVTPESAMTKRFQNYLEGLRVTAQLDRIVVDECHTILEGSKAFRPRLRELGQLGLVGAQMVYLTATLPPSREVAFFDLINARKADVYVLVQ
ncbi:hypothetical protein ACHAQA_010069 [Verticillium albo-atrum]